MVLNLSYSPWWWHGSARTCQSDWPFVSHIVSSFSWYLNENSSCFFNSTVACWHMWYTVPLYSASTVQWHVGICGTQCLCIQLQQYSGMLAYVVHSAFVFSFSSTVACWHMWYTVSLYSASAVQWYISVILWTVIQLLSVLDSEQCPYSVVQLPVSISQWTVLLCSTVFQYASEYRNAVQWISPHHPSWWWSGAIYSTFWSIQNKRW